MEKLDHNVLPKWHIVKVCKRKTDCYIHSARYIHKKETFKHNDWKFKFTWECNFINKHSFRKETIQIWCLRIDNYSKLCNRNLLKRIHTLVKPKYVWLAFIVKNTTLCIDYKHDNDLISVDYKHDNDLIMSRNVRVF